MSMITGDIVTLVVLLVSGIFVIRYRKENKRIANFALVCIAIVLVETSRFVYYDFAVLQPKIHWMTNVMKALEEVSIAAFIVYVLSDKTKIPRIEKR